MTTIAVTTPSGHVGAHLVGRLLNAGVRPRLLARSPARLDADVRSACDVVEVDQLDADAVVDATRGVDALYWVSPPTGADDPLVDHARVGAAGARAAVENDIAHVVFQSSAGAELRHGAGEIDGLGEIEEQLDATLDGRRVVTHLRCGFFFTNLLLDPSWRETGTFSVSLPVDRPMPWVDPADIAVVAATWLTRGDVVGRQVHAVHGPADLSWADAAAVVSRVMGRPVQAEQVPDEAMRESLLGVGMTPAQVEAVLGMSTGLRDGFVPEQPRDIATTTPSTLESWARDHLR